MSELINEKPDYKKSYRTSAFQMSLATALITGIYFKALPQPYIGIIGGAYIVMVVMATVGLVDNAFTVHMMKKIALLGSLRRQLGDTDQEIAERLATPTYVRVRRKADRIVSEYANGAHLHPFTDLVFYLFHLTMTLVLGDTIIFICLAIACLIDFNLRCTADEVPNITRRYR